MYDGLLYEAKTDREWCIISIAQLYAQFCNVGLTVVTRDTEEKDNVKKAADTIFSKLVDASDFGSNI